MKYKELAKNLNKPNNVYIISGNDDYLCFNSVQIIKEKLIPNFQDFNFVRINTEECDTKNFNNIISTLPFGADYRVIVIDNINAELNKIIQNFAKQPMYGVIIVIYKPNIVINYGEQIDCNHLDKKDVGDFILDKLKEYKLKIDADALEYILNISSLDLAYINSELVKICNYYKAGDTVDLLGVKSLLTKIDNYFIYNFTYALDMKNKEESLKILNSLRENSQSQEIFAYLGSYFRRMFYIATSNLDDEDLAKFLRVKPYAIKKSRDMVLKNGRGYYINLYNKYVELDNDIKFGKISAINAIYSLMI